MSSINNLKKLSLAVVLPFPPPLWLKGSLLPLSHVTKKRRRGSSHTVGSVASGPEGTELRKGSGLPTWRQSEKVGSQELQPSPSVGGKHMEKAERNMWITWQCMFSYVFTQPMKALVGPWFYSNLVLGLENVLPLAQTEPFQPHLLASNALSHTRMLGPPSQIYQCPA